jgi:hypothetical protein
MKTDSSGLVLESVVSFYDDCDKSVGSMKGGEFLHQLSDYQFLKKDPVTWN